MTTPTEGTMVEKRQAMLTQFLTDLVTAGIGSEDRRITANDLSMTTLIRIPGSTGLVLLVRVKDYDTRDLVYAKRTRVKIIEDRKIYINEDLTREDADKLTEARKAMKEGRYTSVWSNNGKVYVRTDPDTTPFCVSDSILANERS